MTKRFIYIFMLLSVWSVTTIAQSTMIGVKVGNNGNVSFTNKFKSGNYTEIYNFGNGYHAAAEISQNVFKFLGVKAELSYVNSNFEIDHDSHWKSDQDRPENYFYEEISINHSSSNLALSAVINLGRVKVGFGPQMSIGMMSSGRAARYYYNSPSFDAKPERVQYKFYSKRKQVYNIKNSDETQAYDINRIQYGMNFFMSAVVYKPFSIEIKTFHPMNGMINEFSGFQNDFVNQKNFNAQISVVYTVPLLAKNRALQKKKKRRPQSLDNKK